MNALKKNRRIGLVAFVGAVCILLPSARAQVAESVEPPRTGGATELNITLYGGHGFVTKTPNGEVTVRCGAEPEARAPIPVTAGHATIPNCDQPSLRIESIVLEGRPARLNNCSIGSGPERWVTATWIPRLELHVRDAKSNAELEHVTVVRVAQSRMDHAYPTRAERDGSKLVDDLASPLVIPIPNDDFHTNTVTFFVHARGHAWQPLTVELGHDATSIVSAPPSGTLAISLDGYADEPLTIDVRPLAGAPLITQLDTSDDEPLEMSDLAPGSYRLAAWWRDWPDEIVVAAKQVVDVRAGERSNVTLTIPEPLGHRVVSGALDVAKGWEDVDEIELRFREVGADPDGVEREGILSEPATVAPDGGREYHFTVALSRFPYIASISDLHFAARVVAPPLGADPMRIRVPPPVDVRVRVFDDAGVDLKDYADVFWQAAAALDDFPISPPTYETGHVHRADDGRYEFRAPAGVVDVSVAFSQCFAFRKRIAVAPGASAVTAQLRRDAVLVLSAPWPLSQKLMSATFDPIDGPGEVVARDFSGGGELTVRLTPGRWRVTLPGARVATKDVTATECESTSVEFEAE